MYVTSGNDTEIQLTIDAAIEFANAINDAINDTGEVLEPEAARQLLHDQGFSRAATAPIAAVRRLTQRMFDLFPRLATLPTSDIGPAGTWVNAELTELTVAPSLSDHDGSDLHVHWTPPSATFDDQVMADVLKRFGRCAADDCEHLFYDSSRNGSRRFCSNPRCASRTHTADHRKRRKAR